MRAVELSVSSLFSVLQREDLGEPHTVLAGGERYHSPWFATAAEKVVRRELAGAGLGDRRDYRDLVDMVTVAQRAAAEVYGWVIGVDHDYGVLVAAHGRRAVRLVRSGDTVRVERCDPERMSEALVGRLPDVAAGCGTPFSAGHTEVHPRSSDSVLRRAGGSRPDGARRLDGLLHTKRLAVSKLYAAKRDGGDIRRRSAHWVTVLDLVDGRWALSVTRSRHEKWINAAPGTPALIAERLAELARSVR